MKTMKPFALASAPALALAMTCLGGCPTENVLQPIAKQPEAAKPAAPAPATINPARLTPFGKPLPAQFESPENPITDEKVALGRMLYYDPRLSINHDISCNSCHDLANYGVDGQRTSPGHKKQLGKRNSPTVYNAAGHFVQFWDGRAATIEEQAGGPMINPLEMACADHKQVEAVCSSIPQYVDLFKKAFPGDKAPVSIKNITAAIGAFERKLTTPSRFDKFLGGDMAALSDEEKAGFLKFMNSGCTACHMGNQLGGTLYQKLGLINPWPNEKDLGRFEVTKNEADRMMFKVPGLRNVAKTAPYFHDGSVDKLEDAIKLMAKHQTAAELSDDDVKSIATFFNSLTGEIPTEFIKKPELPPSTKKTPKPNPA
jgi:cytochrome c peroxidase